MTDNGSSAWSPAESTADRAESEEACYIPPNPELRHYLAGTCPACGHNAEGRCWHQMQAWHRGAVGPDGEIICRECEQEWDLRSPHNCEEGDRAYRLRMTGEW